MTPDEGIRILQRQFRTVWLRLPVIVGNEAVNFTLDNFRRQGFLGNTLEVWQKRKTSWLKDSRIGRSVLINTGRLRRSVRITLVRPDGVAIGTDVPYAKAHNEGMQLGVIQSVKGFSRKNGSSVKAHTRKVNMRIPRRRFMGNSPYLHVRIKRVATAEFMKEIKFLSR